MNDIGKPAHNPCPVTFALEVFGDRWTLLVLRDVLLEGRYSYKELLAANPGIATNVLADRLKRLEQRQLVTKTRDPSDARQFVYKPTHLGISVIPMLVEMMVWGSKHGNAQATTSLVERFESDRESLLLELKKAATKKARLD